MFYCLCRLQVLNDKKFETSFKNLYMSQYHLTIWATSSSFWKWQMLYRVFVSVFKCNHWFPSVVTGTRQFEDWCSIAIKLPIEAITRRKWPEHVKNEHNPCNKPHQSLQEKPTNCGTKAADVLTNLLAGKL